MVAVELEACQVPEDPVFPAPAEGYVVSFMAFYERGFDRPHHLTPSGVLHIAAFMTLRNQVVSFLV
jgi:hypothetical protein